MYMYIYAFDFGIWINMCQLLTVNCKSESISIWKGVVRFVEYALVHSYTDINSSRLCFLACVCVCLCVRVCVCVCVCVCVAKELLSGGKLKLKEAWHAYETLVPRLPSFFDARFPVVDFGIEKFRASVYTMLMKLVVDLRKKDNAVSKFFCNVVVGSEESLPVAVSDSAAHGDE